MTAFTRKRQFRNRKAIPSSKERHPRIDPACNSAPFPPFQNPIQVLSVSINPRFVGWIKEWLGQVSVLEPVPLRELVSEEARKGADLCGARGAEYDRLKGELSKP